MSTSMVRGHQQTGLALNEGMSVLGERQVRIPTSGKIRPGIKVLTQAAAKNKKAVEIYDAGIVSGKSYGEIEAEIRKLTKQAKAIPLVPKNVPYFSVRRADFAMPETAARIMSLYGEDRGEGRHLYRFPVVFPVDFWQSVLPHALKSYTRSELVYWSDYGADGKRYCKTRGKIEVDEKSKRAHRPFGGRPEILRPENDGLCIPEKCPEYQARQCTLSGALIFYIPGVSGASALELPMTSFYSMQGIRQQLELMLFTHGRISGTLNGKPLFWVAKRHDDVSMIDPETGKAKKVKQWITVLEADIEMPKLIGALEPPRAVEAAAVLEGPGDVIEGEAEDADGEDVTEPGVARTMTVDEAQAIVKEKLHDLKIYFKDFAPYAANRFGMQWVNELPLLDNVIAELDSVEDADAYRQRIMQPDDDDIPF